jgi:AAA+ ATPase superfamily predicted ATPase
MMIRPYLKELLHWLRLAFFKPFTLQEEVRRVTRRQQLAFCLKTAPVGLLLVLIPPAVVGVVCEMAGIPFDWISKGLFIGPLVWLMCVVSVGVFSDERRVGPRVDLVDLLVNGLLIGIVIGPVVGLVVGLGQGLKGGLGAGLSVGAIIGLIIGLTVSPVSGLRAGLLIGLLAGPFISLTSGLSVALRDGLTKGIGEVLRFYANGEVLRFCAGYAITFSLFFFRPFHLVPHLIQYWRSGAARNPFALFHNSPVYLDEVIGMPLPFLSLWLVKLAQADREEGLAEIGFIAANRPYQRRAAQKALLAVVTDDLRQVDSVEKLAGAGELLRAFPAEAKYLPAGFDEARRRIGNLASNARRYDSANPVTKLILLERMVVDLEDFRTAIAQTPIGAKFYPLTERWLELVKAADEELRRRLDFTPIKNPFIAGNALQEVDGKLFKGRRDIIRALEENIIHPQQRAALLLYGRRRIGKSSTLLNLPNLISSAYIPVYIDLQEAKWREGDGMFCYHLAKAVLHELFQAALNYTLEPPRESEFEQRPFTRLAEYLDKVEEVLRRGGKQALITFDEYERMEAGIEDSRITTEVLNQLRHLVQHRRSLVLLFSGSRRFEELKAVNWADYLINTKTLELSFLEPEEARELMERPVPEFNMRYEPGVVDRILELTHSQPYLLQAIGSELVNRLNTINRMTATMNDLNVAVQKTLVSAQAYFHYTWADECSDEEREFLMALALGVEIGQDRYRAAFQSLSRKEIVEKDQNGYRLSVEMFRFWILNNQITDEDRETLSLSANPKSVDLIERSRHERKTYKPINL